RHALDPAAVARHMGVMLIETETTPNPATLKFLPGRTVMEAGTRDFATPEEAEASPLADALFALGDVTGVFFGRDFVSVTAGPGVDWIALKPDAGAGHPQGSSKDDGRAPLDARACVLVHVNRSSLCKTQGARRFVDRASRKEFVCNRYGDLHGRAHRASGRSFGAPREAPERPCERQSSFSPDGRVRHRLMRR
ncbi:MAG TPA: NifU N-terminal domain-containing protein, partial [Sorangium sp.]|nr:NifU N-terminal domain-containing protein [Sorangium sp.]